MVVFQPRTLATLHLGSRCLALHFNLALMPQLFILSFLDRLFPLFPTASPPAAVYRQHPLVSPAPHLLSRCEALPTWASSATATRQPLFLVPAPCTACLRLLPFPVPVRSPLCRPRPELRSLLSPGGFSRRGFLHVSVSLPRPPQVLLRILASSDFGIGVGWLFAKRREDKAPPLPGSCFPWSSTPTTWPSAPRLSLLSVTL